MLLRCADVPEERELIHQRLIGCDIEEHRGATTVLRENDRFARLLHLVDELGGVGAELRDPRTSDIGWLGLKARSRRFCPRGKGIDVLCRGELEGEPFTLRAVEALRPVARRDTTRRCVAGRRR